jgi:hypothetical protein
MNEAIIGLTVAYVALAAFVIGLSIFSRWPYWVKLISVAGVCGLYFLTYASFKGLLGWPTRAELPAHFMLLASYVSEPDKAGGSAGSIQIWAASLAGNRPAEAPRAYHLDYDAELHGQLEEADKRMRQGIIQLGRKQDAATAGDSGDPSRFARNPYRIVIFDLPDPELPEK